jgi:hypothetical protein
MRQRVGEPDGTKQGPAAAKTSAELAAERLRHLGVDEHRMIVLPVPDVPWHRTYASALTFRNWLIARRWWTSARGMYSTLSKTLGFLYAAVWPLPKVLPAVSLNRDPTTATMAR